MSSRAKKKTTKKTQKWVVKKSQVLPPPTESTQNPPLPDDLLVSCFARVSRVHYLTLSLVSKRFRSLLTSPELYKTRSILGRKEGCLYLCLRFHPDPNPHWFTLYMIGNEADVVYKPKQDRWEAVEDHNLHLGWSGITYCTIDNVLYGYSRLYGINWYDSKIRDWIKLKGLNGLPESCYGLVKLIEYGGKLLFFWKIAFSFHFTVTGLKL